MTDTQMPPSPGDMAAFGASDAACYLYPGEDQQSERAAFCEGAAHAVSTLPAVKGEALAAALAWADRATEQGIGTRVLTSKADMHAGHVFTLANAARQTAPPVNRDDAEARALMARARVQAALRQIEDDVHLSELTDGEIDSIIAAVLSASPSQPFRPMYTWDQRDEAVLLLVDYRQNGEHALDDATIAVTIGHNNDHNVGEGEGQGWQFAGWSWCQDHYTQGVGVPIGWLPLTDYHERARAVEAMAEASS